MPAYNAEKFIAESIDSILSQTFLNWELLIVNDGSTDATKNIISTYCNRDIRIYSYYQQNKKQGSARNLAIGKALGKFVAFIDADDIWVPEKLETQLHQVEETGADLVFSDAYIFSDGNLLASKSMQSGKGYFQGKKSIQSFLERNRIPILTVLIKTQVLREVGGFSEQDSIQNAEDYHLWLKLLIKGSRLYGSELVLAGYREHAFSSTVHDKLAIPKAIEALQDLKEQYFEYNDVIKLYLKRWFVQLHYSKNNWNNKDYKSLIKKNCRYINKTNNTPFFLLLFTCGGFKIARRLINKILNS